MAAHAKTKTGPAVQKNGLSELWVHKVNKFSSQYNDSSWSANCVIGPPKVYPNYGDIHGAWAHRSSNTTTEYVEVEFKEKLFIKEIDIYETYNAGAVVKIQFKSPSGEWQTVYQAQQPQHITKSRIFSPALQEARFMTSEAKITLDCTAARNWCELDAIQVRGSRFNTPPPPPMDDLSHNLKCLVNNKKFSDVTFEVEGKLVSGHKAIMSARSDYFNAMFGDSEEKQWKEVTTTKAIAIKDVRYNSFLGLLEFLYTNKLNHNLAPDVLTDLARVADRFSMEGLFTLCIFRISEIIDIDNVISLYRGASERLPFLDSVRDMSLDFISANMSSVSKTPAFCELPKNLMLEIVQETTARLSIH